MTVSFAWVSCMVCADAGTENAADTMRAAETRHDARRMSVRSIKSYPRVVFELVSAQKGSLHFFTEARPFCIFLESRAEMGSTRGVFQGKTATTAENSRITGITDQRTEI